MSTALFTVSYTNRAAGSSPTLMTGSDASESIKMDTVTLNKQKVLSERRRREAHEMWVAENCPQSIPRSHRRHFLRQLLTEAALYHERQESPCLLKKVVSAVAKKNPDALKELELSTAAIQASQSRRREQQLGRNTPRRSSVGRMPAPRDDDDDAFWRQEDEEGEENQKKKNEVASGRTTPARRRSSPFKVSGKVLRQMWSDIDYLLDNYDHGDQLAVRALEEFRLWELSE